MNDLYRGFNDIISDLRTGDIVLFKGDWFISKVIQKFEHSQWSHVAMVVRAEDLGYKDKEYPTLLWESTPENDLDDFQLNKKKTGPQLINLHERLHIDFVKKYNDAFAVRHLKVERTPEMMDKLGRFIAAAHSAEFPSYLKFIIEFFEGRLLNVKPSLDNFFCSELVAESYIQMGLLPAGRSSESYDPKDFSASGKITLENGAKLGEEISIDVAKL
ncbi:MAG: hypothetical protein Q8936_00105 [Bacillota bacterium]|nr:hypothetical protein [Bacillota bacterium]